MEVGNIIIELIKKGYQFKLDGNEIRYKYIGFDEPDPNEIIPLFKKIKNRKDQVRQFLRCYCPKCGGCVFWTNFYGESRCLACDPPDYELLERLYAGRWKH